MRKHKTIFAMIPARLGSGRLAMKNLALLDSKPLIYYAIQAAKKADIFDRIVVNSENIIFSRIAKRYKVEFYQRPKTLGSSAAKSDFVVHDFIKNNPCDIVVWVNSISPLQTGKEIKKIIRYFIKEKLDSLITVKDEQVHCIYKSRPVNFRMGNIFDKTQDLIPVQPFVYSIMMWKTDVFMRTFQKKGHALFCGKVGFYPVNKFSSVIIKKKEDFMFADYLIRAFSKNKNYKVRYDHLVRKNKGLKDEEKSLDYYQNQK